MDRNESLKNTISELIKDESFTDGELLATIGFLNAVKDKENGVRNYTVEQLIKESEQIDLLNKARIV